MKITTTRYICDECKKEETDVSEVLNWLMVGAMRDKVKELHRLTAGIPDGNSSSRIISRWGLEFCSRECLEVWAQKKRDD